MNDIPFWDEHGKFSYISEDEARGLVSEMFDCDKHDYLVDKYLSEII